MTRPMTDSELLDTIEAVSFEIDDAKKELEERIAKLENRVAELESGTPQARQLQYEADLAAADLAASGYRDYEEW